LTIQPMIRRAHDVAAACRLAMAKVRVQLPLGALRMAQLACLEKEVRRGRIELPG
jgi:hypothetical protein